MPKIICCKCLIELKPEKNGVWLLEYFNKKKPQPYRMTQADRWECPECGYLVLAGFAQNAIHHFDRDLKELVEKEIKHGEEVLIEDYELTVKHGRG